ncbi:hypothetical protein [Amycolatopsis sp. cmx-4-68]|uniref:hypothetical protein n=1 Tax=Amycolatopsis sp. cmx-4-68 TaxID=2790938 RepID=UPI00397BEE35
MTTTRPGRLQQVVLLCAIALGVIAMHHVSVSHGMRSAAVAHVAAGFEPEMTGSAPAAGSDEHHPGRPNGQHDMLHLCLAVLCAVGALLLAFLGISWLTTAFPRFAGLRGSPRRGRPPDRGGRSILTFFCVMRT